MKFFRRKKFMVLIILLLVLGVMWLLENKSVQLPDFDPQKPAPTSPADVPMSSKRALDVLNGISVAEDDEGAKYEREKYFGGWADLNGDGCDTRQEAYKRDMVNIQMDPNKKCEVKEALLPFDQYLFSSTIEKDGKQVPIQYVRGRGADVDIDHRVTLEDAWKHGLGTVVSTESEQQKLRQQFANDPYNLITVNSKSNRQKSYRSIDEWEAVGAKGTKVLIADEAKPLYVAYIVGIKDKYGLTMTQGEYDRIKEILEQNPSQMVPADPEGKWGN